MSLFEAIILGFIQGISEFLPVSSSGHLLVFHHIFGITAEDNLTFIIVLNMGSLLPLLWVFRSDILVLIKNPFQKMTGLLIVSVAPLVMVTLLFLDFIESMFYLLDYLWVGFIITGIVLLLSDKLKNNAKTTDDLKIRDAVFVGIMQAFAVFPGISRSGATITASLARGLDRENAAKFSFLMSIPSAFGAIALRLGHIATGRVDAAGLNFVNLAAGFITAAITGYFAINLMLSIIKKARLKYFAIYYIFALAVFMALFI